MLCFSCKNTSDDTSFLNNKFLPSCENKVILKTFKDEVGFMLMGGTSYDGYYFKYLFFKPLELSKDFSKVLLFYASDDKDYCRKFEKFELKLVKVSGNVTNCIYNIDDWSNECGNTGPNILDLTSIQPFKECSSCENKEFVITVLKDEPAYIKKCYFDSFKAEKFFFGFENESFELSYYGAYPCNELDDEYRKEGLSVLISGKVTNCTVRAGYNNPPNYRTSPVFVFALDSIKMKNEKNIFLSHPRKGIHLDNPVQAKRSSG